MLRSDLTFEEVPGIVAAFTTVFLVEDGEPNDEPQKLKLGYLVDMPQGKVRAESCHQDRSATLISKPLAKSWLKEAWEQVRGLEVEKKPVTVILYSDHPHRTDEGRQHLYRDQDAAGNQFLVRTCDHGSLLTYNGGGRTLATKGYFANYREAAHHIEDFSEALRLSALALVPMFLALAAVFP